MATVANPRIRNCNGCDSPLREGKILCESCGSFNTRYTEPDVEVENQNGVKLEADGTITLDDVESSHLDRLTTGFWDFLWGCNDVDEGEDAVYGITRGSTTLVGGSPGAGKSTLMLQIASIVAKLHSGYNSEVIYIASEEQLKQIKQRAIRLGIEAKLRKLIRMVPGMSGGVDLNKILGVRKPPLIILDSLAGLVGEDDALAIEVCKKFKEFAMYYNCPGIIATHVTKADVIAGKLNLQHEVDTTMTFFPDDERVIRVGRETVKGIEVDILEKVRVMEVQKNRNGRAFINLDFVMTSKGLVPFSEEEFEYADSEESDDSEE